MGIFDFLKQKEFAEIESLKKRVADLAKYSGIVDTDELISKKFEEFQKKEIDEQLKLTQIKNEIEQLKEKYNTAHNIYEELNKQIDIYRDTLDIADYGMYEPHFNFDTSEQYKEELLKIRDNQTDLIKKELAVLGGEGISWNNSLAQGQAMVKRQKKLMLRAFNGECDSFVSSVEWNNISRMLERIEKSYEAINKVYEKQGIYIAPGYKKLKISELQLAFEYKQKVHEEKEEQRRIREQMREEEKVMREIENARIKAEKEEATYQKALDKAKQEAEQSVGDKHEKLLKQIEELEQRLKEAEENKERALSMAQQTKRGHVYVISNIGSFGENVFKIGMTRRLEPVDRIKELSDASVPFEFDIHAMIFSEDAPTLENTLHKEFDKKRLNLINNKKEFFNVSLEEIEEIVRKSNSQIEFIKNPEAKEYRETSAIKEQIYNPVKEEEKFPIDIFN